MVARKLKSFTLRAVASANIVTVALMLLTGYTDRFNPAEHPYLATSGLLFPIFMAVNLLFIAFWVVFHLRGILIPLLGFIACYQPVRNYSPFNVRHDVPEGAIKVLSYNVLLYAPWNVGENEKNPILEYLRNSDADIICLQEASPHELGYKKLNAAMDSVYQYCDSAKKETGKETMMIYSRYPILSKERIAYESVGNMSMAYKIKINGDTVLLINNHLETNNMSVEDKESFSRIVKGELKVNKAEKESKNLFRKLSEAGQKRAVQADSVARYIARHKEMSIIVCGDFNDTPISYAHRTIGKGLTDCYAESGNGPGFSYNQGKMYVRIDHIFCSKDWQPYGCKVDRKVTASDHYPIYCWLKKKGKTTKNE